MVKPVPGKVYLASADGPEIELVALPHGDFQEIGWLDAPLTTDAPQTYSNHAGSKAIDVSFADAAKLTTSITFDAVHAPPLALYWGVGMPAVPGLHDLTPVYTGEAALAPADQAVPTSFPKPPLDGLVKPPTPAQKKMLDGVALTSEEEEETSTPLLTDALISQSLKESFLGPGWKDAGYITEPEPLKWDDLVAAFEPVKVGLKKMHVAIESSVTALQKVLSEQVKAIVAAYDNGGILPSSANPFAPKDLEVTDVDSNSGRAVSLRRLVPGIDDVVKLPCFHGGTNSIWLAIQHLNDYHNPNDGDREPWTREAIADWLETLDADLRVADAPVLRREDWVRGRISGAVGQVVVEDHGDGVVVKWRRSGYQQTVNPRDLVLIEAPAVPKKPAALMNQTWQPGQVVKDPKTGLTGTIVEVKTYSTALVEPDVVELKIAFVPPVGTVIMPASAVQKVEPEVHLPQDELKDWPPEIILDEPLSWQSYGVDSWQKTPTFHGFSIGELVEIPLHGESKVIGYEQSYDMIIVVPTGTTKILKVLPELVKHVPYGKATAQGNTIGSPLPAHHALADPATKAHVLKELTGSEQPPLGCGDVVRLASEFSSLTGKVVQYQVDSNTDPMTITYTVEWGPGGPNSVHSRDELVLVEAYKPPSGEILDWGSNKITKNVY